jgi:hypothetical protein
MAQSHFFEAFDKRNISLLNISSLAQALGVSLAQLMEGVE